MNTFYPLKKRAINIIKQSWYAGGVLIFASMVANFTNFVYNLYIGRGIDLTQFGTVSLINSIFAITSIITSAYGKSISHKTGYLLGKFGHNLKIFSQQSEKSAWYSSLIITLVWLLGTPLMVVYFNTEEWLPFILFVPAISVSFISSYYSGFLNGSLKFSTIAIVTVLESFAKLFFAFILIHFKMPAYIYAAVPASVVISFLTLRYIHNNTTKSNPSINKLKNSDLTFPKEFFFTSIITKLSSVAFLSMDILIAKHYLSPVVAGQYALLSLSGKIIFFLGSLFTQFINPFVSRNEGANITSKIVFRNIFILTSLASLGGYLIIGIFGNISVPILFGDKAYQITALLPFYGLAVALFTLTTGIINYHQIKRRWIFPIAGFVFAVIEIFWIANNTENLKSFSYAFSQVSIAQFIVISILGITHRKINSLVKHIKYLIKITKIKPIKNIENKIITK